MNSNCVVIPECRDEFGPTSPSLRSDIKGQMQGQMQLVMRQLSRRLGEIPPDLRQQIEGLSEAEIDELLEASVTRFESLQDLRTWLTQVNR